MLPETLLQNVKAHVDAASQLLAYEKRGSTTVNATATDMVELAMSLHAARVFPDWTQQNYIDWVKQPSGLSLENWEQLAANLRRRKSGLEFLDRLKGALTARNKEIEEDRRAKETEDQLVEKNHCILTVKYTR